jgi:hypothetical protein
MMKKATLQNVRGREAELASRSTVRLSNVRCATFRREVMYERGL